jgi:adenylate cyclase
MKDPLDRGVRAIARRNSYALVWAQFGLAHLVVFGGLGLLALYQPMSSADFWLLVGISQALVAIDNAIAIKLTRRMWRPVWAWEQGARDEASTIAAWTALATLPLTYLRRMGKYPVLFAYLPFIAFTTWQLRMRWYSFLILALVGTSVLACSLIIRYFTIEIVSRPVIEEVAKGLPSDFTIDAPGLPLRWRLFAAAPIINVVTAVVVAGLSAAGQSGRHHASLDDLGVSWVLAVAVSLTVSLELVVLAVRTLGTSLGELRRATEQVRAGDFTAFAEHASPTEVVSGTVGGGGRVEFTVIGDTVNTAARVEAATRETGDDVLITELTRERLCHNEFDFEERPPVPLKGKSVPVRLWAPRAATRSESGSLAARAPVPD